MDTFIIKNLKKILETVVTKKNGGLGEYIPPNLLARVYFQLKLAVYLIILVL